MKDNTDLLGRLFVVAAPSGAGKTSLVTQLVEQVEDMRISISYTTRPPRPGDENGKDYYFVDHQQFSAMQAEGAFLESAPVYQHHYGTARAWVEMELRRGIDVILEIDWQGAMQVRQQFPSAVSIFIVPPSLETLRERLVQRQQDSEEVIDNRMESAQQEMQHYQEFDYLLVNRVFDCALSELHHIVMAERLRCPVQQIRQRLVLSRLLV